MAAERDVRVGGATALGAVANAPFAFMATIDDTASSASPRVFRVTGPDRATGEVITHDFHLRERSHDGYLDLFEAMARTFGTRLPRNRREPDVPTFSAPYQPLLTRNLSPEMRHGYGDPAVIRVQDADGDGVWYYLLATSNDAPDAFPIARSRDLRDWSFVGFVFPQGQTPGWAAAGEGVSDYWAPEMHRVGGEYRVYFTARERRDHSLSIGLATSPRPEGPFTTPDAPILRGDVIDSHILVDAEGTAFLFWKEDNNGVWPDRLNRLLHSHPRLIAELFPSREDRCTASLLAVLWPWVRTLEPMERFFVQQVLIEAVTTRFSQLRNHLAALLDGELDDEARRAIREVTDALTTPIHAQRLTPDGRGFVGERATVLRNDREWEAHLIEGVWVAPHGGRYYAFYAGNDFSTVDYGIGVAIADTPLGPYRKMDEPFLRSTAEWWGPGHPSVALGPDGEAWLFLHAFFPGRAGYNQFRALLTVPIAFEPDRVRLR